MPATLPPRERQIVDILYEQGPSVVGEIRAALDNEVSGSAVRAALWLVSLVAAGAPGEIR
jgi:hypothetical protein